MTGWSYTKLNRCLSEGRRAFRDRYATIDTGGECARWAPLLSAVADGEATPADLVAVRPHLRACPACRATLRAYHEAPSQAAALLPLGLVLAPAAAAAAAHGPRLPGLPGFLTRAHEVVLAVSPAKVQAAVDAAWSGKVAALAASTVALAGGGVAVTSEIVDPRSAAPRHAVRAPVQAKKVVPRERSARNLVTSGAPAAPAPTVATTPRQPAVAVKPVPAEPAPVHRTVRRPPPAGAEFAPEATPAPVSTSSPSEFSASPAPAPTPKPAPATAARATAPSEFGP